MTRWSTRSLPSRPKASAPRLLLLVAIQPELDPFSSATTVAATLNVIRPGLGQVGASESYEAVKAF
jgi:hypothetical protein